MKKLMLVITLIPFKFFSQLELKVSLLDRKSNEIETLLKNRFEKEKSKYANLFKIEIINTSDKIIYLPLDTQSYAMPFSENIDDYYTEMNLKDAPDIDNDFGVYAFVYQNNTFIDYMYSSDPFYEGNYLRKLVEKSRKRKKEIQKWAKSKGIKELTLANYNRYLTHNILKIMPNEKYEYKIILNPTIKMVYWNSQRYNYMIDINKPYKIIFKIILPDRLKKLLTPDQKKLKKEMFIGVLESNSIIIEKK